MNYNWYENGMSLNDLFKLYDSKAKERTELMKSIDLHSIAIFTTGDKLSIKELVDAVKSHPVLDSECQVLAQYIDSKIEKTRQVNSYYC